jgi:hypothetical protein
MTMFNQNDRPQTVIQQPAPVIQQAPTGSIVAQPVVQQPLAKQTHSGNFFLNSIIVVLSVIIVGMGVVILKLRR